MIAVWMWLAGALPDGEPDARYRLTIQYTDVRTDLNEQFVSRLSVRIDGEEAVVWNTPLRTIIDEVSVPASVRATSEVTRFRCDRPLSDAWIRDREPLMRWAPYAVVRAWHREPSDRPETVAADPIRMTVTWKREASGRLVRMDAAATGVSLPGGEITVQARVTAEPLVPEDADFGVRGFGTRSFWAMHRVRGNVRYDIETSQNVNLDERHRK
ncbi:MAG: hypothetical protein SFX74_09830 [Fimbriimonadaceae bacterium]|nr:hypothetical protein [Fimbriimonadaceae bacterium]